MNLEEFRAICPEDFELAGTLVDFDGEPTARQKERSIFYGVDFTDQHGYSFLFNYHKRVIEIHQFQKLYALTEQELEEIRLRGY